jgi:Uma2 family endonuclease
MARAETHEPETPMTREAFLAWADQQPSGRFERIDGIVVAMAPERASHNLRKGAARDALRRAVSEADVLPGLRRRHDGPGRKQRL